MLISNFKPIQTGRTFHPRVSTNFKRNTLSTHPAFNIIESATGFEIRIAAPGLQKEDFKVTLEKDLLKVSAEKTEVENTTANEQYIREEFSYRQFEKTFHLGEGVQTDDVRVVYEQGILKIVLQKQAVAQAKKISIH